MKNEKQELKNQAQPEEVTLTNEELDEVNGGLAPTHPIRLGLMANTAEADPNLVKRIPTPYLKKF